MKVWHFDIGNSTEGPIGFSAVVHAPTKGQALMKLKRALPEIQIVTHYTDDKDVEYIQVYFNEGALTEKDGEEWK